MLKELVELTRQTRISIIEADRRQAERLNRFEKLLELGRWPANALPRPLGSFGSQIFESTLAPNEETQAPMGNYGRVPEANRATAEAENAFLQGPALSKDKPGHL